MRSLSQHDPLPKAEKCVLQNIYVYYSSINLINNTTQNEMVSRHHIKNPDLKRNPDLNLVSHHYISSFKEYTSQNAT